MTFSSGLAILLLPCLPFVLLACGRRAETKSTASSEPREMKEELIASLQADLTASRTAEAALSQKDVARLAQAQGETRRLAQALSLLLQEGEPAGGRYSSWSAEILAIGSEKSARLATAYLKAVQTRQADTAAEFEQLAERTIRRISEDLLDMTAARQVDAPLAEISVLTKQASGPSSTQLTLFHQFASAWKDYLAHKESGQNYEILQSLANLEHFTAGIEWMDVAKISAALRQARESMGVPDEEQFSRTIATLVEQAFTAKNAQEIDAPLAEIRRLSSFRDYLPDRGKYRASVAQDLMEDIQTAFFARDKGDRKTLGECLNKISVMHRISDNLPIPRSHYLLLAHQLEQSLSPTDTKPLIPVDSPAVAAARMTTLEAIKPNLPALRLAADSEPAIPFASSWRIDLTLLEFMANRAEQLKAGRGMQRPVHENGLTMITVPAVAELQRQFDILCLDVTFSGETSLPPSSGETARSYTARLKDRLAGLEKWESLQTLYTATRALKIMEPVITADDDGAVSGYLYGLRLQNEAKDLRMATCAFQTVLSSTSRLVPADLVGKRLEEIHKSDPRAYSQGSVLALNLARSEGKRAPGERAPALVWLVPARKPAVLP